MSSLPQEVPEVKQKSGSRDEEHDCFTCKFAIYHRALPGSVEAGPPEPASFDCKDGHRPMDPEGDPRGFWCGGWRPTPAERAPESPEERQCRIRLIMKRWEDYRYRMQALRSHHSRNRTHRAQIRS